MTGSPKLLAAAEVLGLGPVEVPASEFEFPRDVRLRVLEGVLAGHRVRLRCCAHQYWIEASFTSPIDLTDARLQRNGSRPPGWSRAETADAAFDESWRVYGATPERAEAVAQALPEGLRAALREAAPHYSLEVLPGTLRAYSLDRDNPHHPETLLPDLWPVQALADLAHRLSP